MKREPCLDGPAVVGDARSHGGCDGATGVGKTRVRCAEVLDCPDHRHPGLPGQRAPGQGSPSPRQRGEAFAEGRVEPLDRRGVAHPVTVRATPQRLDPGGRALPDAMRTLDHPPLGGALDDWGHAEGAPRTPPGAPGGAGSLRVTTRLAHGPERGAQPIRTAHHGARQGTRTHALHQPPHQRHGAVLAARASQPHTGTDQHRQGHPHAPPVGLDADLVGLDLPQGTPVRPENSYYSQSLELPRVAINLCSRLSMGEKTRWL